jgi:iron complex outermembrane receptor protein
MSKTRITKLPYRTLLLLGSAPVAAFAMPVFAQEADATPAATAAADSDYIVVTARRREERLQEVPLAITALSSEELDQKGIESLADLAASTPGLAFQDVNGAYAAPVLRGVAQIDQTGPQGNVGIFIDGVYLNNRSALAFDQYDLARIEVVKGPQSASYGRNTFAGAINYVTAEPDTSRFGGNAQVTIGNYDRYEGKGSINLPISSDIAILVFGGYSEFAGTIKNDRSGENLDGWDDRWSAGGKLKANITDTLTLDLFGVHSETKNKQPALYALPTSLNNCGSTSVVGGNTLNTFYCGSLPYPTEFQLDDTTGYGLTGDNNIYYGRLSYVGDVIDVTALVSYTEAQYELLIDTTGNPDAVNSPLFGGLSRQLFTNAATDKSEDWNFDLRFSSKDDAPLTWMFGMNYYSSLVSDVLSLNFQTLGETSAYPPVFSSRGGILRTKGHALYGSLDYKITPTLSALGELRYTIDDQTFDGTGSSAGVSGGQTFKYLTPRFSLNWQTSPDLLVYATAARGYKTGGFNSNAANTDYFAFGAETNWTYEAGVKATLLDGALLANANLFYIDWQDIHAQTQLPFSTLAVVDNNGDAEVKGIEAQIVFNVTRNIQLSANGALLDPKYKDNVVDGEVSFICGEIAGSTVLSSDCTSSVGGNQIARTTDKQFAVSGSYTIPDISAGVDAYVRADYSWQAGKYSTSLNVQNQGSISLLNARAGVKLGDMEVAIWGKNLLQDKYLSRATVVASTADGGPVSGVSYTRIYPGQRRTYGIDLTARF